MHEKILRERCPSRRQIGGSVKRNPLQNLPHPSAQSGFKFPIYQKWNGRMSFKATRRSYGLRPVVTKQKSRIRAMAQRNPHYLPFYSFL
jgi:hypothetical protein